VTRAVVLAAGCGSRLGGLTTSMPKALMCLADGWTVLDTILCSLGQLGFTEAVVVVGHEAEQIRSKRAQLERRFSIAVHCVVNERYAELNNAYSLWLARSAIGEGVLLVEGDLLFPAAAASRLLETGGVRMVLAVDPTRTLDDEATKVLADDGRLVRVSKCVPEELAVGEFVGLSLVPASSSELFVDALEVTWREDGHAYYEDAFDRCTQWGSRSAIALVDDHAWVEIDDSVDLATARLLFAEMSFESRYATRRGLNGGR